MNNFLIADDYPLLVKAITDLILEDFPNAQIQSAENWKEIDRMTNSSIDLFILDLEMHDGNAIVQLEKIRHKSPGSKILIFTTHTKAWIFQGLEKHKIEAFVSKLGKPDSILEAIHQLKDNEQYMCPEFRRIHMNGKNNSSATGFLTKREKEVLNLILDAKTTREIAVKLSISVHTVESHRKNLFVKFDVSNVVGLVNNAKILEHSFRY